MTKRVLMLVALTVALAVPAASLADDGGSTSTTGAKAGHHGALLERLSDRLDKRFQAFSSHCLVSSPPEKCATVADHFAKRLDKLQGLLRKAEDRIKAKCSAANPPAKCSNSSQVIQKIDDLLGKITTDEAAIKAAFPR